MFLLYFIFGSGWYEPATLVLRGQAADSNPVITVRWDSGAGFNDYEQRLFQPDVHPQDGQVSVVIGATGRKNSASSSAAVVCSAVLEDGQAINLHELAKPPVFAQDELRLQEQSSLAFILSAQSHVTFRFRTDSNSGVTFVEINGKRTEHDLYMSNVEFKQLDYWLLHPDGSFTLTADLPRYPVRLLELIADNASLTAVELHGKGQIADLLHGQVPEHGRLRFEYPLNGMKSWFQPLQFVQQILFALLSVWLLTALIRQAGGLRGIFLSGKRPWFWLMFAGSLTVFGLWLAAFWPGVMSVDSMKIWRAALLPNLYLNDHPLLNIILYKYLRHLWSSPAVVPLTQVLLSSLLISWFGFWIFRQGTPLPLVLFWLLFVLSSVPAGVYNVMLWKDVPFALLTVFWACLLVLLRQNKLQKMPIWTTQRSIALLLLGVSLGLIRHNGMVYLVVLPALLLLLRLVPLKKALPGVAVLLLAAAVGVIALRDADHNSKNEGFFSRTVRWYASTMKLDNAGQDIRRTAREYLTVLDIDAPQADKFHYYLHDRQAWWFLLHSGWWDVYPYQKGEAVFPKLRPKAMRLYEKSYASYWVWLTWNPVWLLALLPALTLFFRWLPNTAVLGAVLLAGALPLVYLQIFNWRYYYFLYFGLLFLPAFVMLDIFSRNRCASRL